LERKLFAGDNEQNKENRNRKEDETKSVNDLHPLPAQEEHSSFTEYKNTTNPALLHKGRKETKT
jgi:hypothetical protein